jgi:hypothetical protein
VDVGIHLLDSSSDAVDFSEEVLTITLLSPEAVVADVDDDVGDITELDDLVIVSATVGISAYTLTVPDKRDAETHTAVKIPAAVCLNPAGFKLNILMVLPLLKINTY